MMKGQAQKITGDLLNKLVKSTREHFTSEEAMASALYPELAKPRVCRRDLIKQVEEYVDRHARGEASINMQLLNFLRDWLTNHIQKEDRLYGLWLKEHGKL